MASQKKKKGNHHHGAKTIFASINGEAKGRPGRAMGPVTVFHQKGKPKSP